MSGSLACIGGENLQFYVSGKRSISPGTAFLDVDKLNQYCGYGMNMLFHMIKAMRCEYPSANYECSLAKTTILV